MSSQHLDSPFTAQLSEFKQQLETAGVTYLPTMRITWNGAWGFTVRIQDTRVDKWPDITVEGTSIEGCLEQLLEKL